MLALAASTDELMGQLVHFVESNRCPLNDEKKTQVQLESIFQEAGHPVTREHHLSEKDIPDFMIAGVAVEVKIKGQRMAIYRQLERYAAHDDVQGIVLVTSVCMSLPSTICGKPARVASLSRGWL